jgi:phosphatidylglycerol:prolipoprotein diacylglycerol transferase
MYPILLRLGPVTIYTYGFFLALAFLTVIFLSCREARRVGLPVETVYNLCFSLIVAALVGARLLHVILNFPDFVSQPLKVFALWEGGLVFYGGLILALAVAWRYIRRNSLPWRTTLDTLAVGVPLAQCLGRIGCFMAGCCYGRPTDLPWAVTFTHPEALGHSKGIPLHPTQLYEAFLLLAVFGVVYRLRLRRRYEGQVAMTYFFLAAWVRFGIEFLRHPDDHRGMFLYGEMPLTQFIALGIGLVTGFLLWRQRKIERPSATPDES